MRVTIRVGQTTVLNVKLRPTRKKQPPKKKR